jgi:hypothetical protein
MGLNRVFSFVHAPLLTRKRPHPACGHLLPAPGEGEGGCLLDLIHSIHATGKAGVIDCDRVIPALHRRPQNLPQFTCFAVLAWIIWPLGPYEPLGPY